MTIAEFLLKLATDEDLLRDFKEDPESVLTGEPGRGLTDNQLALLRAGTLHDLNVKIRAEFDVEGERIAFITVW